MMHFDEILSNISIHFFKIKTTNNTCDTIVFNAFFPGDRIPFILINSPYALQRLKLVKSQANGFQIQLRPEREMVELVLD